MMNGERGPRRDIVLLNAGASLLIAGKTPDLIAGIRMAGAAIDETTLMQFPDTVARMVPVPRDGRSGAARAVMTNLRSCGVA